MLLKPGSTRSSVQYDLKHVVWLVDQYNRWAAAAAQPAPAAQAVPAAQPASQAQLVVDHTLLHPLAFLLLGTGSEFVVSALDDWGPNVRACDIGLFTRLLNSRHHSFCMGLQRRLAAALAAGVCGITQYTPNWCVLCPWPANVFNVGPCGPPSALNKSDWRPFVALHGFAGTR